MLLLASYDIVFQEVPGEVTLALNLSCCPNRCPGCHSQHLREAVGEPLDDALLAGLLARYGTAVTCVAFMGGDGDPAEVDRLAAAVHACQGSSLKTAWYTGREELPETIALENFDFLKLGPYDPTRGGLDTSTTNQRFYRVEHTSAIPATIAAAAATAAIAATAASATSASSALDTSTPPATPAATHKFIDETQRFQKTAKFVPVENG